MNSLNQFLLDPNVIYCILVFGLWAVVTATYIPGTGVAEVLALITLGVGILQLMAMPTNWIAVLLLCLGVMSFLMVPFLNARWARIAQAGLILQVVGALTLFHGMQVSWIIVVLTIAVALAYHNFALMPLLEKSRNQLAVIDDDRHLVGATGYVAKASQPFGSSHVGSVNVRGEQWTANSKYPLEVGEEVVVLERDGLQLFVEGVKHKQTPQPTEKDMEEAHGLQ
jgi:membrane-bound ClpP family serine protease